MIHYVSPMAASKMLSDVARAAKPVEAVNIDTRLLTGRIERLEEEVRQLRRVQSFIQKNTSAPLGFLLGSRGGRKRLRLLIKDEDQ